MISRLNRFKACSITFDTDWAPDWCVRDCYEICKSAGVGATFFVTDYLPVLEEIACDPMFEIGIHPNFFPGSSHGDDERSVLKHCLSLLKKVGIDDSKEISMRTHGLYQSSHLFYLIASEFPQIRRDVSILMPFVSGLKPFSYTIFPNIHNLIRIPYYWEDDSATAIENYNWKLTFKNKILDCGLKIFDFHPIHIALNTENMKRYEAIKKNHDIRKLEISDIDKYKNKISRGPKDFLLDILSKSNGLRICDLNP